MSSPLGIGIIGVGFISRKYFLEFPKLPGVKIVAVPNPPTTRADTVAKEYDVEALTVSDLLADSRIDAVLNLTIPAAHAEVATRVLTAGKHVYNEKPLALAPADAVEMLALAQLNGLRVGSAPDTVLGTGIQTARQVLDSGQIGTPVGATAFWSSPGHELWHPAPQFYYQPGGGPLFDMGPYYLSALVTLLGPVVRVSGSVGRSARERQIATGPNAGATIDVSVDTHVSAIIEHASGVVSSLTVSFDVWASRIPKIEVYGTSGTMSVGDPDKFSDPVELWTSDQASWRVVPPSAGYADSGRGFGLADMARAIETDRPHRASGELALHILEIMDAVIRAASEKCVVELSSTVERPEAVPFGATPSTW